MAFPPTGPLPVRRPIVLVIAALLLGLLVLLYVISAVAEFAQVMPSGLSYDSVANLYGLYLVLMALVSVVATMLVILSGNFGRVFAAGVAGAAMWEASVWWESILLLLFDNNTTALDEGFWLRSVAPLLGGFVGIVILILLAMPSISDWSTDKRRAAKMRQHQPIGMPPTSPYGP